MEWLRSAVQDPSIKDLASSWNDGINLSALVDYCQPGLIPGHATLNRANRLENVKRAMDLAEQHLQIPQLIHPEDLAVDKPDKLSSMTYLSQFCCPNSVGENTLLQFIHEKLPKQNVTNFTTDWVNGHVLEALVALVCEYDPHTSSTNPNDRCKEAMMAAEVHLFVRKILEPSEFINPQLDPRLRMAYLTDVCFAAQPPRMIDTHVPEQYGIGEHIVVDLEVEQQENIEVSAVGEIVGAATVTVEAVSVDRSQVKVHVPVRDQYTVSISYCGRVLRGCPFIVALDSYSVQHIETTMPQKLGDSCYLTFDASGIDGEPMNVKVTGETTGEIEHKVENSNSDCCTVSFIPPGHDIYKVSLEVAGKPVKESPFILPLMDMADPMKVKCGEVVSSGVASPVNLAIDCTKSGKGTLTANCTSMSSGEIPVHIIMIDDIPTAVTFTPDSEDLYLLQVLYAGTEVPGSPWCIDFRNLPPQSNKVRVVNKPNGKMEVAKMLMVDFDTNDAGSGQLTASCNGITSGDVPLSVITAGLGKFQVGFTPMVPDNYFVSVFWAGEMIPGAPFQISIGCIPINASKCRLAGLTGNPALVKIKDVYKGIIGQKIVVKVKTTGAGEAKLDAWVQSPSKEIMIESHPSPNDPETQIVSYTPLYQGNYSIQLLWGGNVVPGSPIRFKAVTPLVFPLGRPINLQFDFDGKKKQLSCEAVLQREGLPEKTFATIEKVADKSATVSLDHSEMEPGTYVFYMYSKYKGLPNSPIIFLYGAEEETILDTVEDTHDTVEENRSASIQDTVAENSSATMYDTIDSDTVVETEINVELVNQTTLQDKTSDINIEEKAEVTLVTESALLESTPPEIELNNIPQLDKSVVETLTLLETPSSEDSSIGPVPRERSYTSDILLDQRTSSLDDHPRSLSVGKRPEVIKTTTPDDPTRSFDIPLNSVDTSHEVDHYNISEEVLKSDKVSPDISSLTQATHSGDDISPSEAPIPKELVPVTEYEHQTEHVLNEVPALNEQQQAKASIEVKEEKKEGDKEKKSKKKTKDKDEQKTKKKEKKREKAEKAGNFKQEKKREGKNKEDKGLNLEGQEFRVGVKMKYKLYCNALGSKTPIVTCNPLEAAKHAIIPAPQFGKNTYWCELTPLQVGKMEVSIVYGNFHIMGSPFSVDVGPRGDASQCTMVETSSTCTQQLEDSLLFCINVPDSAGNGKLVASVRSVADNKHITGVLTTAVTTHHYHIEFPPTEGLKYTLGVKYDDRHIKGSPFVINLGDSTKCKVIGEGIKQAHIDEENTFTVDGTDAGPGELSVNIQREGKLIDPKITVTGNKQYRVSYTIHKSGLYHVSVKWGDGHISNSPFYVPCIAASQFHIVDDSIHRAYAGGTTSFQVVTDALQIRHKQLSVFAHPKSNISKMFSGDIVQSSEGVFTCSFCPKEAHVGICSVHICWNGKEIQGSPYELYVADTPRPDDFLLEAVEIDSGDIAVHVSGPTHIFTRDTVVATVTNLFTNEELPAKVTKLTNEKCNIELLPTAGGEYQLNILYGGCHIANSPLVLTQADPSKCQISGDGVRVSKVNELTKFIVDHSKAGLGNLKVDIEGEGEEGDMIEPFIASGETLSEVSYISEYVGVYRITMHWGEHEFPDSPFTMYTVDPSKFTVLKGQLAKQVPVNQTIRFAIQASGFVAEWERLSVTAKLIHQQQVYRGTVVSEKSHKDPTYKCSIDIPQEGRYAIYVQCRGLDIEGSPFKIRMVPSPKPDKVHVYGPGIKDGVIGQKQEFTIETKEAGHGHIGLKVQGPSGGLNIDMHNSKTSEHAVIADYTPMLPGVYTIHVTWAGLSVPGSPFYVSIRNHRKGEVLKNRDKEWVSGRHVTVCGVVT